MISAQPARKNSLDNTRTISVRNAIGEEAVVCKKSLMPIAEPVPVLGSKTRRVVSQHVEITRTIPAFRLSIDSRQIEELLPIGYQFLGKIHSGKRRWWAVMDTITLDTILAGTGRELLRKVMALRNRAAS